MVIVEANHNAELNLGYCGESERTCVVFDITALAEEYPGGELSLLVRRPDDDEPYPVLLVQDGNIYSWYVNNADTAYEGDGEAQLVYQVDLTTAKTHTWITHILHSVPAGTDPPEPYQAWVDDVLAAAATIQREVQTVPDAIDAALEAAKESGEFDGPPGEDYVLTQADKQEIAGIVLDELPSAVGVMF